MLALMSLSIVNATYAKKPSVGFKMTGVSMPNYNISNFPLELRSVPRHLDDDWLVNRPYANSVLPDDTLSYGPIAMGGLNFYIEMFDIVQTGLSFILNEDNQGSSVFRQNQFGNSGNGMGTSLRYYEITNTSLGIGFFTSIAPPTIPIISITDIGNFGFRPILSAVYQFVPSNLFAESGWDRYQILEKWKKLSIGTIKQHYINYGLEVSLAYSKGNKFNISVGYTQLFVEYLGLANYIGDNKKSGVTISVGMGFSL